MSPRRSPSRKRPRRSSTGSSPPNPHRKLKKARLRGLHSPPKIYKVTNKYGVESLDYTTNEAARREREQQQRYEKRLYEHEARRNRMKLRKSYGSTTVDDHANLEASSDEGSIAHGSDVLDEEIPQGDDQTDEAHTTSNKGVSTGSADDESVLSVQGLQASREAHLDHSDATRPIESITTFNATEKAIEEKQESPAYSTESSYVSAEEDCASAITNESLSPLQDLVSLEESLSTSAKSLEPTKSDSSSSISNVNDCTPLAGTNGVLPTTCSAVSLSLSTGNALELGTRDICFLEPEHSTCKLDAVKAGSSEPEQPDMEDVIDPHAFPNITYYEQLPPEATGSQAPLTIMRKINKTRLSNARKTELEVHEKNRCKIEDKEDWEAFRKILVITDYQTCANEEEVALFRADISFFYGLQEAGVKSWIYYDGTYTLARCEDGYHIFDFDMERTCLISDDREKFFRFVTGNRKKEDGYIYWVRRENWGKELECSSDEEEDWSEEEEEEDVDSCGNGYQAEAARMSIAAC